MNTTTLIRGEKHHFQSVLESIERIGQVIRPDIVVPILFISILVIGFFMGFFMSFIRSIISTAIIIGILAIVIFVSEPIISSKMITILQDNKIDAETIKSSALILTKLIVPIVCFISLFISYFIFGIAMLVLKILKSLNPNKGNKKLVFRFLGGLLALGTCFPVATFFTNTINFSTRAENKLTDNFINPQVKLFTFGKGVGLGKNLRTVSDIFENKDVAQLLFTNPLSLSPDDRQELIEKTASFLNNKEFTKEATDMINSKIEKEAEKALQNHPEQKITNDLIKKALDTNLDEVKVNNKPISEMFDTLNLKDKLNDTGKQSIESIINNMVEKYSDDSVDPELQKQLIDSLMKKYL
ncbi:hypothetical protein [Mycoplasma crocodyli]|uniref:Uncharacterized protein n=1 Tax=Mycoplasma crocodyli (strain ATCC 51981 / MP145) TaxID=512564 RepID=D5E4Q2_MYCCM|nr:hypothetical protein [Mycoplasma crocodyli]ADE19784.1 hypothetical protein MCRO_0063 [Mycoplasma crocodyli MP145]